MGNIIDYIDWRGDIRFSERNFNDIDNLILSELSYINMKGIIDEDESITLSQLYSRWKDSGIQHNIPLNDPTELFEKAAGCARFRDMKVCFFREKIDTEKQLQFAAVTFMPEDKTAYIAFRGTDDTIVGWKEDCNLSFLSATPGQKEAAAYIDFISGKINNLLRIGGHSKGGNFAVYGSAFCNESIRGRIIAVYSNDGPGFNSSVADSKEYQTILPKVKKIIPESSLVGILLSDNEKRTVVTSSAKGIYQHHPYTWCVLGNSFVTADRLSNESTLMDKTLRKWLGGLNNDEKKLFVSALFDMIEAPGAATLDELNKNKFISYSAAIKAVSGFSEEKRSEFFRILVELAKAGDEIIIEQAKKNFGNFNVWQLADKIRQ